MSAKRFLAVKEDRPGEAFLERFRRSWPFVREWFLSKRPEEDTSFRECQQAIAEHMPELVPMYNHICDLIGDDELAKRVSSLWNGPRVIGGCSIAAQTDPAPRILRNYDFPPNETSGVVVRSKWIDKTVICMSEAEWGCLDGMNDAGLAVALTFGGGREYGKGFAIILILRYVLEVCETVDQAAEVLKRIPCSMSQNVMMVDKSGAVKLAYITPGRKTRIVDNYVVTNHQEEVTWPEAAADSKTVERAECLLEKPRAGLDRTDFLQAPVYNPNFNDGMCTVYSADYRPGDGKVGYFWPEKSWEFSFDDFEPAEYQRAWN